MATQTEFKNQFKVKLVSSVNPGDLVIFEVSPELAENVQVKLESMSPMHMPGSIFVYGSTSSRTFSLSVRLISRTSEEATQNIKYLWLLRSWAMPYFGKSGMSLTEDQNLYRTLYPAGNKQYDLYYRLSPEQRKQVYGRITLGSPPDVLKLFAYSHSNASNHSQKTTNIHNVPVVLQSLNIPYTSEVDYIPTTDGVPFPVSMLLELSLQETHAPDDYSNFSLEKFRAGQLDGF